MSIPQPIEDSEYQQRSKSKIVELKNRQKQESTSSLVTYLLATEAIACWLKPKKYPLSLQQVLNLLGIKIEADDDDGDGSRLELIKFLEKQRDKQKFKKYKSLANYEEELELLNSLKQTDSWKVGSLEDELKLRLDSLYKLDSVEVDDPQGVSEFFLEIEFYLRNWYFTDSDSAGFISCSVAFEHNVLRLQNQLHSRLEDIILHGKEKSSLNGSINFLEKLSAKFHELEQEYGKERKKYIDKENGNLRTYSRSLDVLKSDEEDLHVLAENFRIAKKTLLNQYKFKIEAEAYSSAIQVLKKVESTNQHYLGILKDSNVFLSEIKDEFLGKIKNLDVLMPFMVESANHLNTDDLLKKVEQRVGHSLPSWGRFRSVTKEMVREALLLELEPIAQKICNATLSKLSQEYQA